MQLPEPEVLLTNWAMLNHIITSINDEDYCKRLLELELAGPRKHGDIAFRIHSRYNRLRATRERLELVEACGPTATERRIKSYPALKAALSAQKEAALAAERDALATAELEAQIKAEKAAQRKAKRLAQA